MSHQGRSDAVSARSRISRRGFIASAAAFGAAAGVAKPYIANAQAQQITVTSYGGPYEKLFRSRLIPIFQKETGATVQLSLGTARDNIPLMRAAGVDNPPVEVVMTNEVIADILRTEGYFTPLSEEAVPNLKKIAPIGRFPGDVAVTGMLQPIGIAYRSDAVSNPPKSYKEFMERADLKGKRGIYNITNSLGFMFVLMLARMYGGSEDKIDTALAEMQKLKPFSQVDFTGTMSIQLTRGEVDVAPLDFAAVMRLQRQGAKLSATLPTEGLLGLDQVFNVTKGSKKRELAFAWVNFMLRDDIQQIMVSEFLVSPTNVTTVLPPELANNPLMIAGDGLKGIIRHDWTTANRLRGEIVDKWNRAM